jgi:hypothetical protein
VAKSSRLLTSEAWSWCGHRIGQRLAEVERKAGPGLTGETSIAVFWPTGCSVDRGLLAARMDEGFAKAKQCSIGILYLWAG